MFEEKGNYASGANFIFIKIMTWAVKNQSCYS